jgi:DHA2 family multidrug resistance protein-like MFS transporter
MILGVLAFWLFAQTTLNIAPIMAASLGIKTSLMNIAVSIVLTIPKGGMHRGS